MSEAGADVVETFSALDQSALMKLSIRARHNNQAMYKASTGVVETPNVRLSGADVVETLNAD